MIRLESTASAGTNFVNLLATSSPLLIFQLQTGAGPNFSVPLDSTSVFQFWELTLQYVIFIFRLAASPNAQQFYTVANISSFSFEYGMVSTRWKATNAIDINAAGNIAGDNWTLFVEIEDSFGVEQNFVIPVNATGGYDLDADLPGDGANKFFNTSCAAIIGAFQYGSEYVITDIYTPNDLLDLVIWIFVSQYWVTLYDAGQIAPAELPSTESNIFVNETLFQQFSSFLFNRVIPAFETYLPPSINNQTAAIPIQFLPLNDTNRLQPVDTSFFIAYSCTERQLKGWFSVLTSVFTADYAILVTAYGIFIFIAGGVQKRKDEGISYLELRLISKAHLKRSRKRRKTNKVC